MWPGWPAGCASRGLAAVAWTGAWRRPLRPPAGVVGGAGVRAKTVDCTFWRPSRAACGVLYVPCGSARSCRAAALYHLLPPLLAPVQLQFFTVSFHHLVWQHLPGCSPGLAGACLYARCSITHAPLSGRTMFFFDSPASRAPCGVRAVPGALLFRECGRVAALKLGRGCGPLVALPLLCNFLIRSAVWLFLDGALGSHQWRTSVIATQPGRCCALGGARIDALPSSRFLLAAHLARPCAFATAQGANWALLQVGSAGSPLARQGAATSIQDPW